MFIEVLPSVLLMRVPKKFGERTLIDMYQKQNGGSTINCNSNDSRDYPSFQGNSIIDYYSLLQM